MMVSDLWAARLEGGPYDGDAGSACMPPAPPPEIWVTHAYRPNDEQSGWYVVPVASSAHYVRRGEHDGITVYVFAELVDSLFEHEFELAGA